MYNYKELDIAELNKKFKLIDGVLWKRYKLGEWRAMPVKPTITGYSVVNIGKDSNQPYHRLLWILTTQTNVPVGLVVDHINNNRSDNRLSNLQLLTERDNLSKDRKFKPNASRYVFRVVDNNGVSKSFTLGSFTDNVEAERLWNGMAKYFFFRQELKGNQPVRDIILELVESGQYDKAKVIFDALLDEMR